MTEKERKRFTACITDAKAGDPEAFTRLYHFTAPAVRSVCARYFMNAADVEDALQETYVKIYRGLPALGAAEAFSSWSRTIARNTCLNILRSRNLMDEMVIPSGSYDEFENEPSLQDAADYRKEWDPDAAADSAAKEQILREILRSVTDMQRSCILLWADGWTYQTIAQRLGLPAGTVKSTVHYTRKKITDRILKLEKEQGIRLHGMAPVPFFLWLLSDNEPADGDAFPAAAPAPAESAFTLPSPARTWKAADLLPSAAAAAVLLFSLLLPAAGVFLFGGETRIMPRDTALSAEAVRSFHVSSLSAGGTAEAGNESAGIGTVTAGSGISRGSAKNGGSVSGTGSAAGSEELSYGDSRLEVRYDVPQGGQSENRQGGNESVGGYAYADTVSENTGAGNADGNAGAASSADRTVEAAGRPEQDGLPEGGNDTDPGRQDTSDRRLPNESRSHRPSGPVHNEDTDPSGHDGTPPEESSGEHSSVTGSPSQHDGSSDHENGTGHSGSRSGNGSGTAPGRQDPSGNGSGNAGMNGNGEERPGPRPPARPSPTPVPSPQPSETPAESPSPTPEPTPSPEPTPTPEPTPSPEPEVIPVESIAFYADPYTVVLNANEPQQLPVSVWPENATEEITWTVSWNSGANSMEIDQSGVATYVVAPGNAGVWDLAYIQASTEYASAGIWVQTAWNAPADYSGQCGDGVYWSFDGSTLTIYGNGPMYDLTSYHWSGIPLLQPPWVRYSSEITGIVVEEGVTRIGSCSMRYLPYVSELYIPEGVTSIGRTPFFMTDLRTLWLPKSLTSVEHSPFDTTSALYGGPVTDVIYAGSEEDWNAISFANDVSGTYSSITFLE